MSVLGSFKNIWTWFSSRGSSSVWNWVQDQYLLLVQKNFWLMQVYKKARCVMDDRRLSLVGITTVWISVYLFNIIFIFSHFDSLIQSQVVLGWWAEQLEPLKNGRHACQQVNERFLNKPMSLQVVSTVESSEILVCGICMRHKFQKYSQKEI